MARRGHKRSGSEMSDHFRYINEQEVEDITLEFFYKPHTLTLLMVAVIGTFYFAFTGTHEVTSEHNIWRGLCCAAFYFLIISVLAFPNGPFTRPHPAFWRVVFGMSVMYLLVLLFILFQNYQDVRRILMWLFPDLKEYDPVEKEYAVNCSDVSLERLWGHVDWYSFSHLVGWMLKAVLMRSYVLCWIISVMWEVTEMSFMHLLPNFAECWWDAYILDVLLCNGIGIWLGMKLCKKLEMTEFQWESIRNIRSTSGKIKRAVLQFTPASWTHVRWLDPNSSFMRIIAVYLIVFVAQIAELNTFFLKHIFLFPADHPIGIIRISLVCAMSAPTLRQYYTYVSDPCCKRVGTQLWVFLAVTVIELLICIKHGLELFAQTIMLNVFFWISFQLIIVLGGFYAFWWFYKKKRTTKDQGRALALRRLSQQSLSAPPTPAKHSNGLSTNHSTPSNDVGHPYLTRRKVQSMENLDS